MVKHVLDSILPAAEDRQGNPSKRKKPDDLVPEPVSQLRKKARNRARHIFIAHC
jgi:hypothetical protein